MKIFGSIHLIPPSILLVLALFLSWVAMTVPGFAAMDPDDSSFSDPYFMFDSCLFQDLEFYTLDNGLRVVLAPRKDLHTVTVRWSVQVGARDEQPGESGYAHLFEHMMFKGTPRVEDGAYFRVIEEAGGTANAFTSFDVTSYHATCPPQVLKQMLWLEADRLRHLDMSLDKLKNQVATVLEEKAANLDNQPYAAALAAFARKAARGSGYEGLVIGLEQDLKQATLQSVKRFYDQYYHPANIVLTLYGNFEPDQAGEWITQYFAPWIKPGKVNGRKPRSIEFDFPPSPHRLFDPLAPYPIYLAAWLTPGERDPSHLIHQMIGQMLLTGKNSLLKQRLKQDDNSFISLGMALDSDDLAVNGIAIAPRSFASKKIVLSSLEKLLSTPGRKLFTPGMLEDQKREMALSLRGKLEDPSLVSLWLTRGVRLHADPLALFDRHKMGESKQLSDILQAWEEQWTVPDVILEVTGDWKIRWAKSIMQWVPKGTAIWLEDCFL
jgi:zinc protease